MFGRRKRERQLAEQAMLERMQAESSSRRQVKVEYVSVAGSSPAARPSDMCQLTPTVMPIAMVPYVAEGQPLMMYSDDND